MSRPAGDDDPMGQPRSDDELIAARIRGLAETVGAPGTLRRRLDAQRDAAARGGWWREPAMRRAPYALAAGLVLAWLLIAVLPSGDSGPPSISEAGAIALLAPTQPVRTAGQDGTPRPPAVDGVSFPSVSYDSRGWRALGVRRQRFGGRELVVVSYAGRHSARVGYGIVSAPALAVPTRARRLSYGGRRFAVFVVRGATVLTWRRSGRTCVLASRGASRMALLALASWTPRQE